MTPCMGCLGLGHENAVKTPQIIPELCEQRVQQFINGHDFVLAINDMNHVFSWGYNECGQLGRGLTQSAIYSHLKPENISPLNDKRITHVCCGVQHSLALTTNGQVYAWGRDNSTESNYKNRFIELSAIGLGGFGTVFKVKHRIDEHIYAVKRVELKDFSEDYMKRILKEVKNLLSVRSEYCVQYFNSWPESKHLYIQMEFCSQNLRNILEIKSKAFDRLGEVMSAYEYFISCEIFRQILESVHLQPYSQRDDILNAPVVKLKRILVSMASTPTFSQRPDCSQVLREYSEWSVDRNILMRRMSIGQAYSNELFEKYLDCNFLEN
ncbi:unnamed protein product [Oppiella nova]|uniref:Protein kinase domain-containing protein n=1 Tax=Oppiella nova TaxID=334625 RepID=A0A7R9MEF1_9ACAR|nr:unnamed protein product [Oppiella nova]CAG2175538.1 unnamed protein product [Oppiella nova]